MNEQIYIYLLNYLFNFIYDVNIEKTKKNKNPVQMYVSRVYVMLSMYYCADISCEGFVFDALLSRDVRRRLHDACGCHV